ncbi:HNH endonuclease [Halobacteriales archaeon QS_1_68_20]|nr:MAG: HNH endonuclease [Halobacteriales archaeon QS_1_68_20]
MTTSEDECVAALREAVECLDESPTKAQYEDLGLTPASATIQRVMGGWNEAKAAAGLETYDWRDAGGTEVEPKPEDVEMPDDVDWEDLTGQQRWYYKNREARIERKDRRRRELRAWLHEFKHDECECANCGEGRHACLDFHHPGEKDLSVSDMIAYGYSRERIREEIQRCVVLCANCHRVEHYDPPQSESDSV